LSLALYAFGNRAVAVSPSLDMSMSQSNTRRSSRLQAGAFLLLCGLPALPVHAQTTAAEPDESVLQRAYDSAQRYQTAHDLEHAAQQYRIFLRTPLATWRSTALTRGNTSGGERLR